MLSKKDLQNLISIYDTMTFNTDLLIAYCGARKLGLREAYEALVEARGQAEKDLKKVELEERGN